VKQMVTLTNIVVRVIVGDTVVSETTIDTMNPGETKVLFFDIPELYAQEGSATIVVTYSDSEGRSYPPINYIVSWASPVTVTNVVVKKQVLAGEVLAGEAFQVRIHITNNSQQVLKNIVVEDQLPEDAVVTQGSATVTIDGLAPYDTTTVEYWMKLSNPGRRLLPPAKVTFGILGCDKTYTVYSNSIDILVGRR